MIIFFYNKTSSRMRALAHLLKAVRDATVFVVNSKFDALKNKFDRKIDALQNTQNMIL